MRKIIGLILTVCLLFIFAPLAGNSYYCNAEKSINQTNEIELLEIKAKSCVLMDKKSGRVLLGLNEDEKLPMASMTKMMVLSLVMEEIESGKIDLNEKTTISNYAASMEGSECFLDEGESYTIYELIKSVVVASANDSTVALAERISGSENLFVAKMNDKAKNLGMKNTNYINSTGLDVEGHYSTAKDMAIMMRELSKYPLVNELAKVWMYDMNHANNRITSLTNTNRLIKSNPDVVVGKTGHTDNAGYCITAYAERDGKELIACVMGETNSGVRFLDCTKLLNFGFANFENKTVIDKTKAVKQIVVKGARKCQVAVYPSESLSVLVKTGEDCISTQDIKLDNNYVAPLTGGAIVGEMVVSLNGENYNIPLEIREDVYALTLGDIIKKLMD